jgi:hypothetical protein
MDDDEDQVTAIADAMRSAHSRWACLYEGKRYVGTPGDRMLTTDEYRWLAVAALRENRKRTIAKG